MMNSQLKTVNSLINKSELLKRIVAKLLQEYDFQQMEEEEQEDLAYPQPLLNGQGRQNPYPHPMMNEFDMNEGEEEAKNSSMRFLLN